MTQLLKLKNLKDAKYNPRKISDKALAGLKVSMQEYGNLSGIVYNVRTMSLVCGHQRKSNLDLEADIKDYKECTDDKGTVAYGYIEDGGTKWPVRFVDWPLSKEKAANLAGNNAAIQGVFNDDLGPLLQELDVKNDELMKAMLMDEIKCKDFMDKAEDEKFETMKFILDEESAYEVRQELDRLKRISGSKSDNYALRLMSINSGNTPEESLR